MRVIAGTAGGRILKGPPTTATRPMTDRTREAIFNSLNSLGVLGNASILDLFAGTGALGIEALSRGAASCTFVDRERQTIEIIKENLSTLGFMGQAKVLTGDALMVMKTLTFFDIAFVAPPYAFEQWAPIFETLECDIMVCESDRALDIPTNWKTIRSKNYGKTLITTLEKA